MTHIRRHILIGYCLFVGMIAYDQPTTFGTVLVLIVGWYWANDIATPSKP